MEAVQTMGRAQRRAFEKAMRRPAKPQRKQADRASLTLACSPWKVDATWRPLEAVIARLEMDGTIEETARGEAVLYDDANGGWYATVPAIEGLCEFHEIAAARKGWVLDVSPLRKFAAKLKYGSPISERDIEAVKACAAQCRRMALSLTIREASDILTTVRVGIAMGGKGNE